MFFCKLDAGFFFLFFQDAMYQDANGKVGNDPALLTPPLVRVTSSDYMASSGLTRHAINPDVSSLILVPKSFKLASLTSAGGLCVRFVFAVCPPADLVCAQFTGGSGCLIKMQINSCSHVTSCQKGMDSAGEGVFSFSDMSTLRKVATITMKVENYRPSSDDLKTYVRFLFAPAEPPVASVGLALRAHEASMDCRLSTSDGGAVRFHRAVLAARSGYFDKLFFGEFKEAASDTVVVEGSALAWGCIKSMMYAQILGAKDRVVLTEALETVYRYELEAFASPVWDTLSQGLDGAVAVRALRVAGLHQNTAIGLDAMGFIRQNITTLMCDQKWVREYADALEEIGGVPTEFVQQA